ncbi:MAG: DUF6152 family protein [Steroidobacteraceae bacterium]
MKCSNAVLVLAASAVVLAAVPAAAHHSFAMFDSKKTMVLEGTVKNFSWSNPHIWIDLVVKNPKGKDVEWAIEGSSVNSLSRKGWKRSSLKSGDKAVITINPLKDGTNGGSLIEVTVNGVKVGN